TLYFTALDDQVPLDSNVVGLWRSDGTPGGTVRIGDTLLPPRGADPVSGGVALSGVAFSGLRYYAARGPPRHDIELWRPDGTLGGSARVADVRPGPDGSSPLGLAVAGGRLWFSADDGS